MDFLKNLGFDPVQLGAQIINFLIIFYLLKRFLYKPVLNMIKTREDKISQGLKQTEEARIALEKAMEEEKKILEKADTAAKQIIENAKDQALQLGQDLQEQAKIQSGKLLLEAKRQIEQEIHEAQKKLAAQTTKLATDLLQKSLKGIFNQKEQKEIVEKALKDIKTN